MTAYIFVTRQSNVVIYQDTCVVNLGIEGHPQFGHMNKIFAIPELNVAVCGSGVKFFHELAHESIILNTRKGYINCEDPDVIGKAAACAATMIDRYHSRIAKEKNIDIQLYVLGFNRATMLSEGYSITTKNNHQPISIDVGYCVNNIDFIMECSDEYGCILPGHDRIIEHFMSLTKDFCDKNGIGGDINMAKIDNSGIYLETVGKLNPVNSGRPNG
ncbi:MAG: hypothetical protein GC191_20515 [Azospirillum sp.]|nr:hypothetical protein [Azospirillum sp.]